MSKRLLMFAGLMASSVGVPYVSNTALELKGSPQSENAPASGDRLTPEFDAQAQTFASARAPGERMASAQPEQAAYPQDLQSTASDPLPSPLVPIHEALSLHVRKEWVLSRWPRVSTSLADLENHGCRVAWISGTAPDDVAGSLTYYFGPSQQVQRITFQGITGDPRRLTALLMQIFEFRPIAQPDPSLQVYQVRWNGQARSVLEIRAASVVRAEAEHAKYHIKLAINNPDL